MREELEVHLFFPRSGEGASVWGGAVEEQGLGYGGAEKRKGVWGRIPASDTMIELAILV